MAILYTTRRTDQKSRHRHGNQLNGPVPPTPRTKIPEEKIQKTEQRNFIIFFPTTSDLRRQQLSPPKSQKTALSPTDIPPPAHSSRPLLPSRSFANQHDCLTHHRGRLLRGRKNLCQENLFPYNNQGFTLVHARATNESIAASPGPHRIRITVV